MVQSAPGQHLLCSLALEPMRAEHVWDVARLHYKELGWSFNGQLGLDHMHALYQGLMRSHDTFGYVIYNKGTLLGFVTATENSAQSRKHIIGIYAGKVAATLRLLLLRPRFLLGALESTLVVPWVFRRYGTSAEWLTFVTDTEAGYLGPFVALRLIDAVRDRFRTVGIERYVAQGVKQNPKAMALYSKLRWKVVAKLPIHNIYLYETSAPDAASALGKRGGRP